MKKVDIDKMTTGLEMPEEVIKSLKLVSGESTLKDVLSIDKFIGVVYVRSRKEFNLVSDESKNFRNNKDIIPFIGNNKLILGTTDTVLMDARLGDIDRIVIELKKLSEKSNNDFKKALTSENIITGRKILSRTKEYLNFDKDALVFNTLNNQLEVRLSRNTITAHDIVLLSNNKLIVSSIEKMEKVLTKKHKEVDNKFIEYIKINYKNDLSYVALDDILSESMCVDHKDVKGVVFMDTSYETIEKVLQEKGIWVNETSDMVRFNNMNIYPGCNVFVVK